MSPKKYCDDWLESCNLIMRRDFFLKFNGMNEKNYFQEDQEFFERVRKKIKNLKVLFAPNVYVYHRERIISKFLLQRLAFGTALTSGTAFIQAAKFNSGIKGLIPFIPIFSFFLFLTICFIKIPINFKVTFLLTIFLLINSAIYLETKKYIKNIKDRIVTIIIINIVNLVYIIGGIITLVGLRKKLERKIYIRSRSST